MKKYCSLLLSLLLIFSLTAAMAETPEMSGTVVNTTPMDLSFSAAGTIQTLTACAGDPVKAGAVLSTLKTTPVYATADGLAHVFGKPGDSVSVLTGRYGAVVTVEPAVSYTLSCNTNNAFDAEENRVLHPGETVYVKGINTTTLTGVGRVTQVSGSNYTVELEGSSFVSGNTFYIYRDPTYLYASRVGRGSIARAAYTAYTGEGIVTRVTVSEGDQVKAGDLLFETIMADYTGGRVDPVTLTAAESGIIAEVTKSTGATVGSGETVCTLYPDSGLRILAEADEESLSHLAAGQEVTLELTYTDKETEVFTGIIEKISAVGHADPSGSSVETLYDVIIIPSDTTLLRYGMHVTVK